jgi:hypothetical protein
MNHLEEKGNDMIQATKKNQFSDILLNIRLKLLMFYGIIFPII